MLPTRQPMPEAEVLFLDLPLVTDDLSGPRGRYFFGENPLSLVRDIVDLPNPCT